MLGSEAGRKMKVIELLSRYKCTASDSRRSRWWYLSFLVKESICNPWGGMKGVCRVVIAMYDPMGMNLVCQLNWMPCFEWGSTSGVGLFAHLKVIVACEGWSWWLEKPQPGWLLKMIALLDIKVYLVQADNCDQVAW